ncbi:hypothetical protein Pst134EA_030262 [Puccinia striiformis f. sp. tritici]|uniref:Uncharacterized protein n=1 Tax=Puccinia striiformis f. sp. tritici PST-78 TaxID=1165861 RepID=A0A0L0V7J6_9BASI|nr:hypothetical protein Pst134EA_030262 [Puccinia striiformis f. sp. tritici]KAH9446341.1 hypothetical protein Pst134EA_030262 [Puccinia striiformis f. sp. tritici]KNE95156.1 hypothetical protein PSTG_11522 [Puccinia striiformis f. sp. tritici PST-78]
MSNPNTTNTINPSYDPPLPDPRFVPTLEFYPACVKCSTHGLVCGQSTKAAGKGKANKCERCKSKRTREQVEEDEILQEVLEEEAAIARLTKAVKNREPVAGPSKRLRLIIASTPDTEEGVNPGRRFENSLENLGGGFLQTDVEGKELEEAERVEDQQEQGEEEEEEDVEEEEEEQESGQLKRETTWRGIATEEEEILEIDEEFGVVEAEANHVVKNEVSREKDQLFNWSSDDEEEFDVHRNAKEEMRSKVISIGEETAKAVAKLMKMIPKGLKEEAKTVKRDLAEVVEGKIKDANMFLEKEF